MQAERSPNRDDEGPQSLRARVEVAMLRACGELGYRDTSVRSVLERAGTHRGAFYRLFANKAHCYEVAYSSQVDRLAAAILAAGAAGEDWRSGLAAALATTAAYLCEDEARARGVLVAVHVGRTGALAKRDEIFGRLSRALDSARREPGSHHSPPPLTATLMLFAVENLAIGSLLGGGAGEFAATVPELEELIVTAYFGRDGRER